MWHMKWSLACLSVLTCCTWLRCGPVRWHPLEGEYPDTAVGKLQRLAWVSVLCGVGVSAGLLPLLCDDQHPALACCAPCSSPLIGWGLSRWSSPSSLSILETAERHACGCMVTSGSCLTFQWSTSLAGYSIQEVQISSCELEILQLRDTPRFLALFRNVSTGSGRNPSMVVFKQFLSSGY